MNTVPTYTYNWTSGAKCANCGKLVPVGYMHGDHTEYYNPNKVDNPEMCVAFGIDSSKRALARFDEINKRK